MTKSVFVILLAGCAAQAQRPPEAPQIISPEVHSDRRITLRLQAPKATEVIVSGEFAQGAQAMQKDEKGVWSITLGLT